VIDEDAGMVRLERKLLGVAGADFREFIQDVDDRRVEIHGMAVLVGLLIEEREIDFVPLRHANQRTGHGAAKGPHALRRALVVDRQFLFDDGDVDLHRLGDGRHGNDRQQPGRSQTEPQRPGAACVVTWKVHRCLLFDGLIIHVQYPLI